MVWTYPGHGPQTMGNLDPFELKDNYVKDLDLAKDGRMTVDYLYKSFTEVFNVLDPNKKGYANKDDIMALTVDKLKAIADIVDPDYANTEEYEHVLFGEAEVRDAFQDALEEGNGELHLQKLIQKYKDLGGSEKVARELFAMLKPKSKDKATADEVEENLANVLELYKKIRDDDKSGIFYDRHLQEDKEIMAKTLDGKKDTDGTKHEEL